MEHRGYNVKTTNMIESLRKGFFGVFLMTLGVSAQANVITIDDITDTATVDCTAGSIDPACLGFIGDGLVDPITLSEDFARIYTAGSSEADATDFLNSLIAGIGGIPVDAADAVKIETGGADSFSFQTDGLWFAIKTGLGTSFFKNEGGSILLDVFYVKNDGQDGGQGAGISHVTIWGGEETFRVAEPGTLLLLGMGLAGLGLARRRKV